MDWVITGEGKLDGPSAGGKAPFALLQRVRATRGKRVKVMALAGRVEAGGQTLGFDAVFGVFADAAERKDRGGAAAGAEGRRGGKMDLGKPCDVKACNCRVG